MLIKGVSDLTPSSSSGSCHARQPFCGEICHRGEPALYHQDPLEGEEHLVSRERDSASVKTSQPHMTACSSNSALSCASLSAAQLLSYPGKNKIPLNYHIVEVKKVFSYKKDKKGEQSKAGF